MDKNIIDFINVCKVNDILLLSPQTEEDIQESIENTTNITMINISQDSNISSIIKRMFSIKDYGLLIIDQVEFSINDILSKILESTDVPLIIINKNNYSKDIPKNNLMADKISENSYLLYTFDSLHNVLNNEKYQQASIGKYLDNIYYRHYKASSNNSIFYPLSLLFNSDKIGGIKNLPLNIKGYKELKKEKDFNIGYYLRTNNIKDCEDVYLHYLFNAKDNGYSPNPYFNKDDYIDSNPDLKKIDYDPFIHYLLYGKKENRIINDNITGTFQNEISNNIIKGWIAEIGNDKPVEAYISIDDKNYPIKADIYREDLKRNNINNGKHGFEFKVPNEYNDDENHDIKLIGSNNRTVSQITYNYIKGTKIAPSGTIKGAFQTNIKDTLIRGWIAEIGNNNPINANIEIEGELFPIKANIYREDLKRNNINNGVHGFEFNIPSEFVDGKKHKIQLIGPNNSIISKITHTFINYDYENNIERFFSHSMISPEIVLPPDEPKKKVLSLMDNIAKYLINQVEEEPLVSIIMPTYNREEMITNAISSVLEQSYKNFELIVIDDASSDNTLNAIKEFDDCRIKIINNESNLGVSKSRNIGLKEAKGKYIMYLDSDNDWEKDYLKATVGSFIRLPDADAVYSGQYVYEKDKEKIKYIRYGTINKGLLSNRNYVDLNCYSHTRKIYEELGGFDENLERFVDWDLILKYMTFGRTYSIPFIMSNYYFNIAENSISNNTKLLSQSDIVIDKQHERMSEKICDYEILRGISVIIPSYESLNDLKECLNSLFNLNAKWLEIIVVDNNSSEDVIRYLIKLKNESRIKLILNQENLGFTYAVNQAIEIAQINNDIVLLNNDAVITKYALHFLQKAAYELDDCGITVPQQVLPAKTKTINVHVPFAHKDIECDVNLSAHHKNVINVPLFHNGEYTELSFAPFFCVYIKRDTYNMSIGLDAELGRHFRSDMIFCNYIRTVLNQKIYHVSDARVYHKLQKATETLKEKSLSEHNLLYVQNRWSKEEQEKYGFKQAKWDLDE
ncbi:MAG: hypothetical protein BZ135_02030 [Methanosphaera sp. rholeuAM6]|nr:MAG: hypothetical protein BZ135_02030 [Methanosphaera sp. rholeuAM6]